MFDFDASCNCCEAIPHHHYKIHFSESVRLFSMTECAVSPAVGYLDQPWSEFMVFLFPQYGTLAFLIGEKCVTLDIRG